MPNIAAILKSEISRVARKEIRAETQALRKSVATYRSEQTAEQQLRKLARSSRRTTEPAAAEDAGSPLRFGAKGLASHRKRLGLSAEDCGLLIGASSVSIYKWEAGARPRPKYLPAIAAFRSLGKREAAARLEPLKS